MLDLILAISQNGTFWVGVSFGGLVALLIYFKLPARVAQGLDAQREAIAKELEEAETLYNKAQALLAQHQAKLEQHAEENQRLLATAKQQALDYQKEQEALIAEKLARLEAQAKQRIENAKKQAVNDLRKQTFHLALGASQKLIAKKIDPNQLIEQSIAEIEAALNKEKRH